MTTQTNPPEIRCAHDCAFLVEDLKPNPRNPNKHPDDQIKALAKIISHQGWRAPIIVSNQSGFIVAGHGRYDAAVLLGLESVPVNFQDFPSDADEWAHLVADNRLAELAELNKPELADLLLELDTGAFDLTLTGYDENALAELVGMFGGPGELTDTEEPIEPTDEILAKWQTDHGQTWALGDHRIYCGDSTERADVLKMLAGDRCEVVFTDPPYGVNVKGGKGKKNTIAGDLTQTAIPFSFEIAVQDATTDTGRFYFCGGEGNVGLYHKLWDRYLNAMPKLCIWVKNAFVMKPNGYHNQFELIYYGFKTGAGSMKHWYGGRTEHEASDVWQIRRDNGNDYLHPTQKPVELPARAIRNSCPKGGMVYEPFSGSGSTVIACENLGHPCRAMELDPRYLAVTIERWHQVTGKEPERVG